MKKNMLLKAGSVVIALVVWQIVSMAVGMEMLLASPLSVIQRLAVIWKEDGFFFTVLFSLLRITAGFLFALLAGIVLASLAGKFKAVETLLWPWVVTVKTVPVASFIIFSLIWFTYSQLTVFIAFLIAFPVIYNNILQGIKNVDDKMLEMAKLHNMSWGRRLLYVNLPGIKPYLFSACSTAVGMAWKAGIAAEVIGIVKGSIGEKLYESKIYIESVDLFAWTVIIILLSVLLEKAFMLILKALFKGVEKL